MPANADGEPVKDEGEWIKAADASYLPTNEPKTIEFYVPEGAQEGAGYFVLVRTRYCRSGIARKEAATGFSPRSILIQ